MTIPRVAKAEVPADSAAEPRKGELVAFSLPEAVNGLYNSLPATLANPILVSVMGVSPAGVGLVMMLRGLWDAVTDPVMGHVTDSTRSRFGRRRPYILLGGLLMAGAALALWQFPAGGSETSVLWYFGLALAFYATAQTVFSVPYGALSFELSPSYHGRTRVQMARALAGRVSSFVNPYMVPFCMLAIFATPVAGARWLGAAIAVLIVAATAITAWKCKERAEASVTREPFAAAVKATLRCPEFWRITSIYVVLLFALGALSAFQYFTTVYYVFRGDLVKGTGFIALVETWANLLVLLAIPGVNWMCRRLQKHNALRIALGLMVGGSFLQMVLMDPERPWLMFVSPLFYSLGIVATFMILGTLMADAVDADELRSGVRREGLFSAASAFMMKTMLAIGAGVSGILIQWTGFDASLGGDQPEGVFDRMLLTFAAKGLLLALGFIALHKYPLTEARVAEIQAALRTRREEAAR
jgi:GPH family glycoside/pentoside/hexuronide:cation symporter